MGSFLLVRSGDLDNKKMCVGESSAFELYINWSEMHFALLTYCGVLINKNNVLK